LSVESGISIAELLQQPEHHLNAMLHYVFNKDVVWNEYRRKPRTPWSDLDDLLK